MITELSVVEFSDALDIKSLIPDANMRRRMSAIVKSGVACGMECLRRAGIEKPTAIITATALGCIADSEKFLRNVVDDVQPSPTPFIQSTFNTIGSQIAIITGCNGYNMTYVNRTNSLDDALLDARLYLNEATEKSTVLVVYAEETTPTSEYVLSHLPNACNLTARAKAILLAN
ncbi:MAG: hypothetical protein E7069_05045 [Bacteroidales bacterium]|jgi:hypothetical protein|nr:hypothetical protein [Bacteroidales bacterium]